jgi:hypothetical protein
MQQRVAHLAPMNHPWKKRDQAKEARKKLMKYYKDISE